MKALLIVDLQNDFMPGGPLGVPQADTLADVINPLLVYFPLVVTSQDWHPAHHISFASVHPGKKVGDQILVGKGLQMLWPVHCVRNTEGAALVSSLHKEKITTSFFKGTDEKIDSYSAFFDNDHTTSTGLGDFLKTHNVTDLFIAGVATDYCVLYSALDALSLGFRVYIIQDACKPICLHKQDEEKALAQVVIKGGHIVFSHSL